MKTTYNQYAAGGTTPRDRALEKEKGLRPQDYKGGQPLTENQLEFLTQSLSDEERELFQDMYSQGLIHNDSVKSMFRQGKPMSASAFRASVLKNADGPATTANLNREFGKMFGDGMKTQSQGSGLAKIQGYGGKANVYRLQADQDWSPEVLEEPIDDPIEPTGSSTDEIKHDPLKPLQPDVIPRDPDKSLEIIEQLIEKKEEKEDPDPIKVIKDRLEASNIGLKDEEVISDTLGTAATTSGGEQATKERLLRSLIEAQLNTTEDVEDPNSSQKYMSSFQELEMGGRIFNRARTYDAKQLRDMLEADRRKLG